MSYRGWAPADVVVRYAADIPDSEAVGSTRVRRQMDPAPARTVGLCAPQLSSNTPTLEQTLSNFDVVSAEIFIQQLNVWFTQADTRRRTWENDCNIAFALLLFYPDATTCTKLVDFGSTMAHELGHTFVLRHPTAVPTGVAAAHCGDVPLRATLCSGPQVYRSERRTLENYDIATVMSHQGNN